MSRRLRLKHTRRCVACRCQWLTWGWQESTHTRTGDERFNYLLHSTQHSASTRSVYQINWGPCIKDECVYEAQQQTNIVITSQANLILWLWQHCYFYASIVFSLKPSPEILPNQYEFYTVCVLCLTWRSIPTDQGGEVVLFFFGFFWKLLDFSFEFTSWHEVGKKLMESAFYCS